MPGNDLLTMWLQLGAGFLAIMFVVAPLVVAWRARLAGVQAFAPAQPQDFLEGGNDALRRAHEALAALGFRPTAATWFANGNAKAQVLVYRLDGDPAVAVLFQQSRTAALVVASFDQPFADATRLTLTNSPLPSVLPRWDRVHGYRLAGATPGEAWRAFTALRRRHDATPLDLAPGQEVADLQVLHRDTVAWLAGTGRFVPTADGRLRLRLADAYLASWRMLWPMSALLAWRDARRVRSATHEPMQA